MKSTLAIFTIVVSLFNISGCDNSEKQPLLMCDFADARESVLLTIILHDPDGDRTCSIRTDEYGIFSYSPEINNEFAELEFMHEGREYGAVLQRNKHVKMVIANGQPIYSCDNKECNETCEAIRRMYNKENFIHSENSPALYEEKTEQLDQSSLIVRQYLANISDQNLRDRLSRRATRIHREYAEVIDKLKEQEGREEYNQSIEEISLNDDYLIVPSVSIKDAYVSSYK